MFCSGVQSVRWSENKKWKQKVKTKKEKWKATTKSMENNWDLKKENKDDKVNW